MCSSDLGLNKKLEFQNYTVGCHQFAIYSATKSQGFPTPKPKLWATQSLKHDPEKLSLPWLGFNGLWLQSRAKHNTIRAVQHSNCLTTWLTHACTGHTPIGEYAAQFHKELSRCMCSHPHELVIHIIHLCPLHTRSPSPGKCYQLVEFVKFLKRNPRAFEWLGARLAMNSVWTQTEPEVRGPSSLLSQTWTFCGGSGSEDGWTWTWSLNFVNFSLGAMWLLCIVSNY